MLNVIAIQWSLSIAFETALFCDNVVSKCWLVIGSKTVMTTWPRADKKLFFTKQPAKLYFLSTNIIGKPLLQCDSSLQATYLDRLQKMWVLKLQDCVCFFKTVCFSVFISRCAHCIALSFVFQFLAWKRSWLSSYSIILSILVVWKNHVDALKEFILFHLAVLGWKSSEFKHFAAKPKLFS